MNEYVKRFAAAFAGDIAVLVFAAVVLYASFSAMPADAYDFPRLVSALLAVFAVTNCALNFRRLPSSPISLAVCRRLLPGIGIFVGYIYLCDIIGFYLSAMFAFMLLSFVYDSAPDKNTNPRRWIRLFLATAGLMICVYLLFNTLLQVQTPEPFWVD